MAGMLFSFSNQVEIALNQLYTDRLCYSDYPILPSYDKDIPADVQANFEIVGIVVNERSLHGHSNLKLSSVGKCFTAGEYFVNLGKKLCSTDIANTPAVFVAGTGSIISRNRFLTAYHVAEDLTARSLNGACIFRPKHIIAQQISNILLSGLLLQLVRIKYQLMPQYSIFNPYIDSGRGRIIVGQDLNLSGLCRD